MRRVFRNGHRDDAADSFREKIAERGSLFYPRRVVVRITGKASRRLSRDEELGKLGMSLVKFRLVRRNLLKNGGRFFQAVMFVHQADNQLHIPRLGDQSAFPARVSEIIERIRRFGFFLVFGITGADEKN